MAQPRCDLIYDVGLLDPEDRALSHDYRVVATDANPLMVERARRRFTPEIDAGCLTLFECQHLGSARQATFWIADVREWSSSPAHRATESAPRLFLCPSRQSRSFFQRTERLNI
jgi:hypothetical protein